MNDYKEMLSEMKDMLPKLGAANPDAMKGFQQLKEAIERDGALPKKMKVLIALATAITQQCDWCIVVHVKDALAAGATKEEILETGWVAVMMGGGPALMYFQGVQKALDDLGA
ncbi:MAG: carboxymuconolactone decarboxylase family protein [archaeon]